MVFRPVSVAVLSSFLPFFLCPLSALLYALTTQLQPVSNVKLRLLPHCKLRCLSVHIHAKMFEGGKYKNKKKKKKKKKKTRRRRRRKKKKTAEGRPAASQ